MTDGAPTGCRVRRSALNPEVERVRERGGMVFSSVAEGPRLEDGRGSG